LIVENVPYAMDHRLRKQVDALVTTGHVVTVVCPRHPDHGASSAVRILDYPAAPAGASAVDFVVEYAWSWLCTAMLVVRASLTTGFDILQIAGSPDVFFTLGVLARWMGKAVIFDQRDLAPETYLARFSRKDAVYRLLLWLERRSYGTADHVLVVNQSLKDVATGRGQVDPAAVTIVGNGPVLAMTSPVIEGGIDTVKLDSSPRVRPELTLVWVGVIGPQDHLNLAVRAFAELVTTAGSIDCRFVVIGEGDARADAEALSSELGIRSLITFTGWLDPSATFAHLATADIGVDSNLDAFVSPVKVMEYMAFSLPVVAFDTRETRLLTQDAALLAAPGDVAGLADAMKRLVLDSSLRVQLGQRGRRQVEQVVAWDRQRPHYLEVYRSLLS
jgi:glycosyltransferase involved in cell wall biosynthesis